MLPTWGTQTSPDLFADRVPSLADSIDMSMNIEPSTHCYTELPIYELLTFLEDGKYGITETLILKFLRFSNFHVFFPETMFSPLKPDLLEK